MGQFLAVGLVTRISVRKKEVETAGLSLDQLVDKMKEKFYYESEIYTQKTEDEVYYFTLKNEVIQAELIPLLEELYPVLYDDSEDYKAVSEKLKVLDSSEWLKWAEGKPEEAFQFDNYGEPDYIKINRRNINIHYEAIMLSIEGKIIMECYGRQFNFFKYTMKQAFKQFSLSGALRTYISG